MSLCVCINWLDTHVSFCRRRLSLYLRVFNTGIMRIELWFETGSCVFRLSVLKPTNINPNEHDTAHHSFGGEMWIFYVCDVFFIATFLISRFVHFTFFTLFVFTVFFDAHLCRDSKLRPLVDEWKLYVSYAVVTCDIKLFWNNFEIVSVFYFTPNRVWNWNKIISAADGVLKSFQNYFRDTEHVGKYSRVAINLCYSFEIILFHM